MDASPSSETTTETNSKQAVLGEDSAKPKSEPKFTPSPVLTTPIEMPEFKVRDDPLFKFFRSLRLFFRLRGRVKKGSILYMELSGALPDEVGRQGPFSTGDTAPTLPQVTNAFRNAAHDPRISAIYVKIKPLACGYAKLIEIRRHMDYFKKSGKTIYCYFEIGGEKEYYLSMGCDKVYVPPEAFFSLKGFRVNGSFLRGVLDKIGVEPQVERIGEYKSAGDQFARTSMSEAQREVLTSILQSIYNHFVNNVVKSKEHLNEAAFREFLDRAPQSMQEYKNAGLITDIQYEDQIIDALKLQYNKGDDDEKKLKRPLRVVNLRKYARTTARLLGLSKGSPKNMVAIIRANGAIGSGKSGKSPISGSSIGSDTIVQLLRQASQDERIKAVVLRIDSPGGSALASDIMWREIRKLREKGKIVVASMVDVAASGGYYMAMACDKIVAEEMTLTGSIGVVTAKLSLAELYRRIGFVRQNLSLGRFAELDVDNRSFTVDEAQYFKDGAKRAYTSFVTKAAESRSMPFEELNQVAQGRVWTGKQGLEVGLVDYLGGIWTALDVVRQMLGNEDIKAVEDMRIVELKPPSPLFDLSGTPLGAFFQASPESSSNFYQLGEPLAISEIDSSSLNTMGSGMLSSMSPLDMYLMNGIISGLPVNAMTEVVKFLAKSN
eukprot:CAMPEP_0184696886 /NCGR_PEP_ID=MMETSP0313-20130426/4046_1 /TAXON_ID=2792 /ORGANISM="Porphyridium aerugineum, Strain SAG 1380-2" /LENGTH=661 /DNA_ID=CAMNT_0027155607 /DNA_START=259 /DNA_END=2244 /DNA_ORIENTATION=+